MAEFDRLKGYVAGVVRALVPVDTLALYPARVVAQDAQGRLDLAPDSPKLPTLSAVPVRLGLPGAKVEVSAGARVLVGFQGGDARLPYAALWEESGLVKLYLGAPGATEPAALGATLASFLGSLKTWLDAHTHAGVTPGGGVTGPPAPPSPSVPTVTAAKVEVI